MFQATAQLRSYVTVSSVVSSEVSTFSCWDTSNFHVFLAENLDAVEKRQVIPVVPCLNSWHRESMGIIMLLHYAVKVWVICYAVVAFQYFTKTMEKKCIWNLLFCCCCLVDKPCVTFLRPPWTVDHKGPLSVRFPSKNTRVGCHFLLQGSFQPRDRTQVSFNGRCKFFTAEPSRRPNW